MRRKTKLNCPMSCASSTLPGVNTQTPTCGETGGVWGRYQAQGTRQDPRSYGSGKHSHMLDLNPSP